MYLEEMIEEVGDIKRNIAKMQDNGIVDDEDIDWGRIYENFESAYCYLEKIKDYLREIQWEREKKLKQGE
jgi:hypothetical protein